MITIAEIRKLSETSRYLYAESGGSNYGKEKEKSNATDNAPKYRGFLAQTVNLDRNYLNTTPNYSTWVSGHRRGTLTHLLVPERDEVINKVWWRHRNLRDSECLDFGELQNLLIV